MTLYALLPLCMLGAFAVFIVWWRLESYRKAAERDASRAWKIAAEAQERAYGHATEELDKQIAENFVRIKRGLQGIKQDEAVAARRAQEAQHRGSRS